MSRKSYSLVINQTRLNILCLLQKENFSSSKDLEMGLKIGKRTILRALTELVDLNLVQRSGKGKNIGYSLTSRGILDYQLDYQPDFDLSEERLSGETVLFEYKIFGFLAAYEFSRTKMERLDLAREVYQKK